MKVSYCQSIRYIELGGSHFNADGGSNRNADLQLWLDTEAESEEWKNYCEEQRQGSFPRKSMAITRKCR